jgi:hypothetical protein
MASFTVVWDAELESSYIEAWLFSNSASRAILSEAANWLDRELRLDADLKGHPALEPLHRTIDVVLTSTRAHVSAVYAVLAEDRLVRVQRLVFRRA